MLLGTRSSHGTLARWLKSKSSSCPNQYVERCEAFNFNHDQPIAFLVGRAEQRFLDCHQGLGANVVGRARAQPCRTPRSVRRHRSYRVEKRLVDVTPHPVHAPLLVGPGQGMASLTEMLLGVLVL
jgi:hypothetical protein